MTSTKDELICCEDFRWMIDRGFFVQAGKFFTVSEMKSEKGHTVSTVLRWCPFCGEGEMSFPEGDDC